MADIHISCEEYNKKIEQLELLPDNFYDGHKTAGLLSEEEILKKQHETTNSIMQNIFLPN